MSFKHNWIERAPPVPRTGLGAAWSGLLQQQPKFVLEGSSKPAPAGPLGLVKIGWLRTLKNSARNWVVRRSLNIKFFTTDTSQFLNPESRKMLRVALPIVPWAGGIRTVLPFM